MISTDLQRVKIQSIVESQLPSFVQNDFPLLAEFLKQYYTSQEAPTASADVLQNIDQYVKRLSNKVRWQQDSLNVSFGVIDPISASLISFSSREYSR